MMTYKGRELALQGKPFDSAYQAMMERDCGVTVQPLYTTPACHDVPEPDAVERAEANQAIWVEIAEERKVKLDALIARVREYARWVSSQMHNLPRCATADAVNERSRALLADLDAGVGL